MDEASKRRPGVDPARCAAVALADGNEWLLAKPVMRMTPAPGGEYGYLLTVPGSDFAPLRRRLREAYEFAARLRGMAEEDAALEYEAHPELHLAGAELAVARALLLANYDLTDEEVGELVQFSYDEEGDPEGARIRDGVMAVARGDAPKATAGGGGSP